MKYLLALLFTLLAANAFASKPDSGICPWKMPFHISVSAQGESRSVQVWWDNTTHQFDEYMYDSTYTTLSMSITVDTSLPSSIYSLQHDSLKFNIKRDAINLSNFSVDSVTIVFSAMKDSILNVTCISDSFRAEGGSIVWDSYERFQLNNLAYNDTSIVISDTLSSDHAASFSVQSVDSGNPYGYYGNRTFTSLFIQLSGIFQSSTLSELGIVTEAPAPNHLALYASNGSIACSFDVADRERDLELYSPLGIREASLTIPPNESQASLPRLASGIYFVRLEGDVKKLYVP